MSCSAPGKCAARGRRAASLKQNMLHKLGNFGELYATTFFSDNAAACVDGHANNTLGFK
jgi:hypothetical protein